MFCANSLLCVQLAMVLAIVVNAVLAVHSRINLRLGMDAVRLLCDDILPAYTGSRKLTMATRRMRCSPPIVES